MANMIAIRAHFRARFRFRARARARARTRTRTRARARARAPITESVQLHSEVGRGLNEHNSTTGCFRLRARARFDGARTRFH
jgi:hypothetical protein